MLPDLQEFITRYVTRRPESCFLPDLRRFEAELSGRIDGRSVLVIGGAGTIGSAFIKALLRFRPARLFVVDTNENGLTELVRDLRSSLGYHLPAHLFTYPIDFGDPVFERLLRQEGPFEIVANFAAHKHVRSEKDPYSIEAMLTNNVFKARHLLDLLVAHRPERFFCVSTDKAANPVNVMGASKKLMEQVIMAYSTVMPITTARFANVAFSNGSLPAGFLERLAKRQPLSAPLDVERYFVSPEESGQLCLLACMLGQSGEIFFPKFDPASDVKKFSDIAVALLQNLGYQANLCASEQEAREKAAQLTASSTTWPVYFFHSDTSGEKALEEFYTHEETLDLERFSSIGIVTGHPGSPKMTLLDVAEMIAELRGLFQRNDLSKSAIVQTMRHFVPGFQHVETGKGLDSKM